MNKIKRLNDYKITAGGYIFDLLDRASQAWAATIGDEDCEFWLTSRARIQYLRQSKPKNLQIINLRGRVCAWNHRKVYVTATLYNSYNDIIAVANFTFIGKEHLVKKGD